MNNWLSPQFFNYRLIFTYEISNIYFEKFREQVYIPIDKYMYFSQLQNSKLLRIMYAE